MKQTQTLIFLEDRHRETELVLSAVSRGEELIVIGHATSEMKLVRMLKEFIPDVLMASAEMLTYEFLLKLYPLLNNTGIRVVAYSSSYGDEEAVTELRKKLKYNNPFGYFHIRPDESNEDFSDKFTACLKSLEQPVPERKRAEALPAGAQPADRLIVIGSSAGGPRILNNLLIQFPPAIPAAIVIVQHIPLLFSQTLVQSLAKSTSLKIKEAEEDDVLLESRIYVARGDHHLEILKKGSDKRLHLHQGPKVWSVRPAVDVTMVSAANAFKDRIVAIILTGIGNDGAEGVRAVKKAGGTVIAQNQETCLIYGMPKTAVETGCVDFILPYYRIAEVCANLIAKK